VVPATPISHSEFEGERSVAFEYQPVLSGELVELRPLRSDDFRDLYAVAADPLLWEQHQKNRHEEAVFEGFFRDAMASGGALVAIDVRTRQVIGTSRFHGYKARLHDGEGSEDGGRGQVVERSELGERSEVEIGWTFLARSHWGGTYNAEMKRLMLQHAFGFVDCVLFVIGPQNLRSQRAVEKLGGIRAGSRLDPSGEDNHVYVVTAPD
jgi:RimJ/RimL family protein N-acetyltransferase